ncbi:carbohydrate-responsive element-binding protein-like [Arapaima gigas]
MAHTGAGPPRFSERTRQPESDSDSEDEHAGPCASGPCVRCPPRTQVIHSGHFMVSSPHSDDAPRRRRSGVTASYDFDTVNKTWCHTYRFGPRSSGRLSIDPTLTRLFECMTLAYSGKIVSPKWKSFKGLRLLWRDKIRMNNAIWRAWYIQYVEKRKTLVCGFVTPLEGSEADAHRKPEAIILEGSYWKRRIEVVIKEYHKWRIYYKKRLQKNKDEVVSMLQKGQVYRGGLERWSTQGFQETNRISEEAHTFDLDCFLSDISDTLFTMTQKPSPWSEDGHNSYSSNADMIQPGLTPLQPSLDDLMEIPDIFVSYYSQPLDQAGYPECSHFPAAHSGVSTEPLLQTESHLLQPNLAAESTNRFSHPSTSDTLLGTGYHRQPLTSVTFNSSNMTSEAKYKQEVDYGLTTDSMPYEQQPFTDTSGVASAGVLPSSPEGSFLYPTTCLKYRHCSATTSSVTHVGSAVNILAPSTQAHGYPDQEVFSFGPCGTLGYPLLASGPPFPPSYSTKHTFSVPDQTDTGSRGKYKQKTAGVKMATSVPPSSPLETSCLAKLLSAGTQERKPSLGFDSSLSEAKGHSSASSSCPQASGMQMQHSSPHGPELCQPSPLASRGSPAPTLLAQGTSPLPTPLLVPKTEKLSPVQTYGSQKAMLTGNSGQISPTNPTEKTSNPQSPHSLLGQHKMDSTKTETRRITHISAEQKRRFNIKLGFDTLQGLVTTLSSQPSIKISKATTLQKTAEYISKMQQERAQLHEEAQRLREEIVGLNSAINLCQQQLPATGVPITRQRFDHMRDMFREYVRTQTLQNWKFWIFSVIFQPLFESYNGMVSTASVEDLCRTTLCWLDQHCSLPALRPTVLSSLRFLSTSTSILTDPSLVPEQATMAVSQTHPHQDYS